jgi:hypothetical protein
MNAPADELLFVSDEVTITRALPEAGIVTVAAGPAVARSV